MSYCDECDKGIEAVPYKCRTCGKVLCPEHRLRELHTCEPKPAPTIKVQTTK